MKLLTRSLEHQSGWLRKRILHIVPLFIPYYRIILFDLVCAESVNPDYFYFRRYTTLDTYVDDLLNILDALGVDQCAYVGHSFSTMVLVSILASIRHPKLFTKSSLLFYFSKFLNIITLNDKDYHGGFKQGEIEKMFSAMEANYEAWTLFNMRPDISLVISRTVFKNDLRGVLGMDPLGRRTTIEILKTKGHLPHLSAPMSMAQILSRALSW
ncbi:hypothetical protein ES288_A05G223600v1 [Gossypium darwinii]|uniref:AB hydrolase-1 domain-containing protein n=1 Tax=Gossypium darwinii TaxID=34276 RepID=A0A5D2GJQ1_GOSDA|nr:hypothetical protein ES288_A05G223600v1 [Gossypium darwinii]